MKKNETSVGRTRASTLARDTIAYQTQFFRRSIVFLDILRARANNMLAHEQAAGRQVVLALEEYRKSRDLGSERLFSSIYGSPLGSPKPLSSKGGRHALPEHS